MIKGDLFMFADEAFSQLLYPLRILPFPRRLLLSFLLVSQINFYFIYVIPTSAS